jgi:pSer/pThr/pTyr-binding forkhead associated (FHA) protein
MGIFFFKKKSESSRKEEKESLIVEPEEKEKQVPPVIVLLVERGGEQKVYELPTDRDFKIGRNPKNDLCLDEPSVSDFHAKISPVKDSYVLYDLLSESGVKVNKHKVHQHRLKFGDRIEIGYVTLLFDLKSGYRRDDEFFEGMERRKAVRISPPLTLRFVVYSRNKAEEFLASIKDISLEGAGVEIKKNLPKGSMIEAQIYSSELLPIELIGTVVRERSFKKNGKLLNDVGIQFLEMTEESRKRLRDYLIKCVS